MNPRKFESWILPFLKSESWILPFLKFESRIPGLFEIWIQNPWTPPYRALQLVILFRDYCKTGNIRMQENFADITNFGRLANFFPHANIIWRSSSNQKFANFSCHESPAAANSRNFLKKKLKCLLRCTIMHIRFWEFYIHEWKDLGPFLYQSAVIECTIRGTNW